MYHAAEGQSRQGRPGNKVLHILVMPHILLPSSPGNILWQSLCAMWTKTMVIWRCLGHHCHQPPPSTAIVVTKPHVPPTLPLPPLLTLLLLPLRHSFCHQWPEQPTMVMGWHFSHCRHRPPPSTAIVIAEPHAPPTMPLPLVSTLPPLPLGCGFCCQWLE